MPFYDSDNYDLDRSLGYLVGTLSSLLNDELDTLLQAQLGVTIAQWRALTLLQLSATPTASWVCGELHYDSGAMTRLLDKLAALGLIVREPDENDRRAHQLIVTKKGRTIGTKGFLLARDNLNRALSDLDASQCEVLIGLLQTVKGTMLRRRKSARTAPVDRSARKR